MTFTVAFFILAIGVLIGYRLPGPVAKLKDIYRRHTLKPVLLRAYSPKNDQAGNSQAADQRASGDMSSDRGIQP